MDKNVRGYRCSKPTQWLSKRQGGKRPARSHSVCVARYYKRLPLLEMQLLHLAAEPSRLSWSHSRSTLTIHYVKPPALLAEVSVWSLGVRV